MKLNFTYKKWHSLILLLFIFGFANQASAQTTYYARATGNWKINTTWSTVATATPQTITQTAVGVGIYPLAGDIVKIDGARTVTITANSKEFCSSITVKNGGTLTYLGGTGADQTVLTCSGTVEIGTKSSTSPTVAATKGTLNLVGGTSLICRDLLFGNGTSTLTSFINGRNVSTGSAYGKFTFTGSGVDVIPSNLPAGTPTLAQFNNVVFQPTSTDPVFIPSEFSATNVTIANTTENLKTVNFEDKYSTNFLIASAGTLTMNQNTVLKSASTKVLTFTGFELDQSSTINYNFNGDQAIKALTAVKPYQNLKLSGSGVKTVDGNLILQRSLTVDNVILNIVDNTLTLNYTYQNIGTGCLRGSKKTDIMYYGNADSSFAFDQIGGNEINNITIGSLEPGANIPTPGTNNLDVIITTPVNVYGTINFAAGHLVSNGNVTFKSDVLTTALVGPISDLLTVELQEM